MKICPSCGAELDEKVEICPICEHSFSEAVKPEQKPEIPETAVSSRLDEMKARIEHLAKSLSGKEATPAAEKRAEATLPDTESLPETEEEVEPEPPEEGARPEAVPGPPGEAFESPEGEIEYEEGILKAPGPGGATARPGMPSPAILRTSKPEKVAYKISSSDARKKVGVGPLQIAIAVIIVIIVVIASWFILFNRSPTAPAVDGYFDEWTNVVKYKSFYNSNDQEIDFTGCAVLKDSNNVFWYFSTVGDLYPRSDRITTYALFVDSDGNPATGFSLMPDFGADLAIQISGSGGQRIVSMTGLLEFAGTDNHNWSSWQSAGPLVVGNLGKQVETSFQMTGSFSVSNARFMAISYDGISTPSVTLPFSLTPGILLIQQTALVGPSGAINTGQNQQILQLHVKGYGTVLPIEELRPTVTGIAQFYNIGPIVWADSGQMATGVTLNVLVNTSAIPSGTLMRASMELSGIVTEYKSVVIIGRPAIGYVGAIPGEVKIDGIFADWSGNYPSDLNDVVPVTDKNIDIMRMGQQSTHTLAAFYVDVLGGMMSGDLIPVKKRIVTPAMNGGSGGAPERVTGEDILRIYIDVDPGSNTGAPTPVNGSGIRPDYMLDVRGRNGVIQSKTLNYWTTDWYPINPSHIEAATGDNQIEIGFAKSDITANLSGCDIAVTMTDWNGASDNMTETGVTMDPFKMNLTGKIWGSLDGTSWTARADVLSPTNSLVDMTSDSAGSLYAVFANGTVYRSDDGALSWSRMISSALTGVIGITCDRTGQLYVMTSSGNAYNASLSGGGWSFRGKAPGNGYIDIDWSTGINPATTVLYAVKSAFNSNVQQSPNGGVNWVPQVGKPPTNSTVSAVAAVRSGGNDLIYILEADGDLRVSNDSGNSWTSTHISPGGSSDFTLSPCVDLDTDPSGNVWVVRGKGEVYRLTVSPWNWQTISAMEDSSDIQAFSTMPIPEFGNAAVIGVAFAIIPIFILARRSREDNQS